MTTATEVRVMRHVCPVCKREVAEVGWPRPVFRPHSDGIGKRCPMTGEPIPPADGS